MSQYYDAFISYGRADSKAFATKLYQDLTKQGFKVWFDQNDIPLGVDFQNQIDDGIEKAHNFLFIIAPHSVNSLYCLKEIELAFKCNKRIIPLLHVEKINYETWRERNPGKTEADWEEDRKKGRHSSFDNMHPEISRINWVYFRENVDNYDKSLADLIKLFGRHEDYVSQHTQFLVKALEWERHQKQTRYLLTGKERQAAEKWLKVEFNKEQPPCIPANLHCEFICESIKNANNLLTQVFLSYAEADRETMAEIKQSLMRQGITVWTNLTDIQTGSEFIQEINRGIEGADNVVFLLSPAALQSPDRQQELTHALSLNKRIIYLLIEPTDLVNAQLQHLTFVDLTVAAEEYQQNLDKLIKELRENAVYYQQHKVLLVKALKWQEQNHNRSILLRGYNLDHYQSWLSVAGEKGLHPPTDLQMQFIAESGKQAPDVALDVFISYSRADADFARKLNDALQTQGKTTWFDQESIATGTDFQQEINRGIEQSDNFLFIISPESVNSPYCAGEVEHAKGLNKRFVTVLHRGVNTGDLHPELAKVQWLDFNRHGGDFLGNFSELVRALDTDREYVREHTKKSQMALEWTKGDKSVDLLLRGNECVRAYEWLQEVEQQRKQPELTKWLREYIVASKEELERLQKVEVERQQRELRKQRRDKLVLSGFLALMTGLSIFSVLLALETNKQSEIAQARQLAAESESAAGSGFYQRGTLLAVESMRKFQKQNKDLGTADKALRSGLSRMPDLVLEISHDAGVTAVAFSPDGKHIATASNDNTAGVWDAATGEEIATITEDGRVNAVAFSPDGKYVTIASNDATAGVWSAATGEEIATITDNSSVNAVAFSPDGKHVAIASFAGTGGVWDAATGEEIAKANHDATLEAVAFSPDGKYVAIASYDATARVWNAATGEEIAKVNHDNSVNAVAFSPDGKYIATGSEDKTARVWDAATGEEVATITQDATLRAVAFSPDGKYVTTGSYENTARVWDAATGEQIATITHDDATVWAAALSPDGKYIATASSDKTARVWDATTREEIAKVNHDDRVFAVAFSPDGKYIVTGSEDKTARVWDAATGEEIATITDDAGVVAVAFSPDGKYIATGSYDNTARVWDAVTEEKIATIIHDDWVVAVAFSPDGKYIATASDDNTAQVWDLATEEQTATINHDAGVVAVAFSFDGKYVATASYDATAGVWDAATGEEIATINHDNWVKAVAFTPDDKYLATVSKDNTAGVHFLKPEDLINEACRRLSRNLTADEWERYMNLPLHQYQKTCKGLSVHRSLLAEVQKLALKNKLQEAEKLLGALLKLDDKIDLLPRTEAIEQDPRAVVRQFQAEEMMREGVKLANNGKVEEAIRLFEEAQKLEPDIYVNPTEKGEQIKPEKVALRQAAKSKVSEGVKKAEDGKIEEATRLFLEAQEFQADIDLNPNEKGEQIKPEKVARRLAAKRKVWKGVLKAEDGETEEATRIFQEVQKLQPDIDLNPYQKGEQIKPEKVARRLAGKGKVRQGVEKATDGEIEEAIRIFQQAHEFQPDIDLNPYQKGEQIKPEKVARRFAAKTKVLKGVRLAAEGKVYEAIRLFQKAQELQPNIDLFPYTEEIENDPEALAVQLGTSESVTEE